MRLVVDLNKCQGYAQYVPLAPKRVRPVREVCPTVASVVPAVTVTQVRLRRPRAVRAAQPTPRAVAWGGPLFARALGIDGAGASAELLQDLHDGLVSRVAGDPQRYRRDYHQALIGCRKEPD